MPGGNDPDNRRDFPGGWPGDPRNAFEPAAGRAEQQAVWEHVRKLTATSQGEQSALRRGRQVNLFADDTRWVYARELNGKTVLVAINNGGVESEIRFPSPVTRGTALVDALGAADPPRQDAGQLSIRLKARTAAVYVQP